MEDSNSKVKSLLKEQYGITVDNLEKYPMDKINKGNVTQNLKNHVLHTPIEEVNSPPLPQSSTLKGVLLMMESSKGN